MNKYEEHSKAHLVIQNNACGRKKSFDTKDEAYQKGQISYECWYCGKFHRASAKKKRGEMKKFSYLSAR